MWDRGVGLRLWWWLNGEVAHPQIEQGTNHGPGCDSGTCHDYATGLHDGAAKHDCDATEEGERHVPGKRGDSRDWDQYYDGTKDKQGGRGDVFRADAVIRAIIEIVEPEARHRIVLNLHIEL